MVAYGLVQSFQHTVSLFVAETVIDKLEFIDIKNDYCPVIGIGLAHDLLRINKVPALGAPSSECINFGKAAALDRCKHDKQCQQTSKHSKSREYDPDIRVMHLGNRAL